MKHNIEDKFDSLGGIIPIGDFFVPFGDDELRSLEQTLNVELPQDYRDFLMTYGAAMFAEYVDFAPVQSLPMPISDTGKGHVSSFYGAARDPYQPLVKAIEMFQGRIPETLIPIADDGGNKICLGIKGMEEGKIYYWDHDNELDEQNHIDEHGTPMPLDSFFQNVYLVADSFEDFVRRLEKSDRG